jgi:hypothetical protein
LAEIEARVSEFEAKYEETSIIHGGGGWVPKIKKSDYAIAIAVNVVIVIYYVITMLTH